MGVLVDAMRKAAAELAEVEKAKEAEAEQHKAAWLDARHAYEVPRTEAGMARTQRKALEEAIADMEVSASMFPGSRLP
jgi:hypothetical protein